MCSAVYKATAKLLMQGSTKFPGNKSFSYRIGISILIWQRDSLIKLFQLWIFWIKHFTVDMLDILNVSKPSMDFQGRLLQIVVKIVGLELQWKSESFQYAGYTCVILVQVQVWLSLTVGFDAEVLPNCDVSHGGLLSVHLKFGVVFHARKFG